MEPREPIELPVEHLPNADPAPYVRTFEFRFGGPPSDRPRIPQPPQRPRVVLPVLLFLATCVSTFSVGGTMFGERTVIERPLNFEGKIVIARGQAVDWTSPVTWSSGLKYSAAIMAILLAHEMGHYLQARRYGVPASLPWFIPMPASPMGTMGAVIVQASGYANRKQLFDIGISGPLAGLVLAIPICIMGQKSQVE